MNDSPTHPQGQLVGDALADLKRDNLLKSFGIDVKIEAPLPLQLLPVFMRGVDTAESRQDTAQFRPVISRLLTAATVQIK